MIDKGKIIAQSTVNDLIKHSSSLPTTVQIETLDGRFANELQPLVLNRINNVFTLRLDNNNQLLHILNTLKTAKINFDDIEINKPSLEDIFINYLHNNANKLYKQQ